MEALGNGKRADFKETWNPLFIFYDLKRPCSGGSKKVYWSGNKGRRPVARPP
jgi:hypothetical protein